MQGQLVSEPPFSWVTLVVLFVIVGVSVLTYVMLVRRWTSRRQWVSLAQWARETGFRLRPIRRDALPPALVEMIQSDERVRYHLCDARTTLVQFETDPLTPGAPSPKWNLLIRARAATGPAAALRPGSAALSLIDLLPLSQFPTMSLGDRFIVYATQPHAARALAESRTVALLPQDLGVILMEDHFVLDFSSRPFDPIEFGRMLALADQLLTIG